MKVLVISKNNVRSLFSWPSEHELIFSTPEEALESYLIEKPAMVLAFAEYNIGSFKNAEDALDDIKMSSPSSIKKIRLGFLPEQEVDGEHYIRLPVSLDDHIINNLSTL